jgi:hypothetical protein
MKSFGKRSLILLNIPITLFLIWSVCLLGPFATLASEKPTEVRIPKAVNPGLKHLFDLADPDKNVTFDLPKVLALLNFVESPKDDGAIYYANIVPGLTSAYHDFDIRRNLMTLADLAYNPDIPGMATTPSSARLYRWTDSGGHRQAHPAVSRYLKDLKSPVIIRGRQFVENTPDLTSGAYYGYSVDQILLLFKYRQRNVFISVSRQTDASDVGKKGYVLGADSDWDYLYSGKTGLTLPALGWVRSFMYDSRGINIYAEVDPAGPTVRCGSFKWLRAGWSGVNMVQKKHIYRGLKRFAAAYREIVESPLLPPAAELAGYFTRMRDLSVDALRSKMEIYCRILKSRYLSGRENSGKWPKKLLENNGHWQRMSKEEMESALTVEYMKFALGKTRKEEVGELLGIEP